MIRYRFFIDFEKEEQWLNQMARQGYEFTGKNMFSGYCFRRSQTEDTSIRIDYCTLNRSEDFQDYRQLFEDSGCATTIYHRVSLGREANNIVPNRMLVEVEGYQIHVFA